MKPKLTKKCRQLSRQTGDVARQVTMAGGKYVRHHPWTSAGIAAGAAILASLAARQLRGRRPRTVATAGEGI